MSNPTTQDKILSLLDKVKTNELPECLTKIKLYMLERVAADKRALDEQSEIHKAMLEQIENK